ncbi:dipeptidase [Fusobacterium sp. SYSU M8D902]|uniref:dipeptidase n=1 Tax=Fusobacterium sp. SYSU M8D902 TaxID=3159562 RepID=UPI0032E50C9B
MKMFDGHADIWYDVAKKRKLGEERIVERYHLDRMRSGNIMGGIFIAYLGYEEGQDDVKEMLHLVNSTIHEIKNNPELFNIIKKKGDFNRGLVEEKLNVLMGIEGLRAIGKNLDWLDTLYELGFRHASLTWNEENDLATGVGGDENRGLTDIGLEAVKKMEKLGMIIDVSHANEKTFWDIFNNTTKPIIASHSNAYSLCKHKRNLTDEQIKAIASRDGIIGVNAYKGFVAIDPARQNLEKYVDHIEYIISLVGVKHVALGFDFCEYLNPEKKEEDINPKGLENASKAYAVIEELRRREYSESDIRKIAYENFMRIAENLL